MPLPRPDVADLLDVAVPEGGTVIVASDLHLPPERTDVSGRSCAALVARLTELSEPLTVPLTVVLAGDIVELLGFSEATVTDILRAHEDLCTALLAVTERGGQVVYTIGNHDGDLAWDVKSADAVWELTGARLCLAADLIFADGEEEATGGNGWKGGNGRKGGNGWKGGNGRGEKKVRIEHGHQLDPYNCFHDPRNSLDTPIGHHIVREVIPRIEWLGRGWVDGAHEMADPTDFPSFVASRLVYRKLIRHAWWLVAIPLALLIVVRIPAWVSFRSHHPDTGVWIHRSVILGYGAVVDLVVIIALVAVLARRAWLAVSALALDERGYGQNQAARQRAEDLVGDGYLGFVSGHTHHPELRASGGSGFYANSGSCTSVVEAVGGRLGLPPAYVRTQQVCWLEITSPECASLMAARVVLPGATRGERFAARGRDRYPRTPARVASWPSGKDWPAS